MSHKYIPFTQQCKLIINYLFYYLHIPFPMGVPDLFFQYKNDFFEGLNSLAKRT
jgi:hypothetical protein